MYLVYVLEFWNEFGAFGEFESIGFQLGNFRNSQVQLQKSIVSTAKACSFSENLKKFLGSAVEVQDFDNHNQHWTKRPSEA